MWDCTHSPNIDHVVYDAWENGYIPVNEAFARAIIDEVAGDKTPGLILLNDYHLYLASTYIRRELPNHIIQHFIHIPWPSPRYWQLLPSSMRQALFRSLCTSDIVGLQTARDVYSFLDCCQAFIDEADIDYGHQMVQIDGHIVQVKAYPISVDVAGLKKMVASTRLQGVSGETASSLWGTDDIASR